MTRRPLIVILAVLMAFAVAGPVAAKSTSPSRLDLPPGWMPEGITAGCGQHGLRGLDGGRRRLGG